MAALSSRYAYEGTETTEVAITRVGSPADPTGQVQSRKIVTTANSQWLRPFRAEPYVIWNPTAGADVGVTVYGTVNSGALPLNDEIFMEVEYLTLSGAAPLGKLVSTTKSNVLATPAAVSADGSTWSNIPPTTFDGSASAGIVISNGGLTVTHGTTSGSVGARSLAYRSAGKFYFEMTSQGGTRSGHVIGVLLSTGTYGNAGVGQDGTLVSSTSGSVYSNNVSTGKSIGVWVVGDVIGLAIDLTSGLAWFRRNAGNWNGDAAANPATGVGGVFVQAAAFSPVVLFSTNGTTDAFTANFGTTSYVNAAPSGFLNWNDGWVPFKLTATLNAPQPGLAGYIDVRVRAARPASTFYIDPTVVLTPAAGGTNNAATAYTSSRYTYEGTETTETSITRVGGAVDPTGQAQSRKIVTTPNAQWLRPFKAEPYAIWNTANGINVTVTLCGTVNAGALPLNDEIFMEVEYLTLAAAARATLDGGTSNTTLSNNNLTATHANATTNAGARSGLSKTSGKYYFEATFNTTPTAGDPLGLLQVAGTFANLVGGQLGVVVFGSGIFYSNGGQFVGGAWNVGAIVAGDVVSVAVSFDTGFVWFRRNGGAWNNSGISSDPAVGTNGVTLVSPSIGHTPAVGFTSGGSGNAVTMNFGATAYAYAPPSGFSDWIAPAAPLGKLVTTTKSNVLAAPAAVAADASTWSNLPVNPAFTPASLTGLVGWWDVSVTASLNLTGSDINSMADLSSSGKTISWQNLRPVYNATGGIGGRPRIEGAIGSILKTTAFPMGTGNTMTMWFVGSQADPLSFSDARLFAYFAPSKQDFNWIGSWCLVRSGVTRATSTFARNSTYINFSPTPYPALHRFIATVRSDGLATLYVDGVPVGTFTQPGNWDTGGDLYFGGPPGQWSGFHATECGVATGYSDDTGVAILDNYLATKWGLPIGWTPFRLTTTLSSPQPGVAGYIHARVRAAKPSAVYYIDPKITLS